ncbi:DUF4164 family protein [Lutibaculum baratangense]|uniref:DUF4164 family protein n=1 Tax=Lutibaculum baratangense AMV1 TaxID=631454 RepID=V4RE51_9HYPH|nr:DUF4164 family protein [Lutibaculum baratangense]ESR23669.1 hypothetical protein N177_2899 [Lutibaculum baratangense AMV1]
MTKQPNGAERAQERLDRALDLLEARVARELSARTSLDELQQEIETLTADRSRLAQQLDKAQAHAARLDAAAGHAEERVGSAIGTIKGLLGER